MDENGVTRIAEGQEKERSYKRENEKSWRMTMSKNLRSKTLAMIMMMLIVLVGGSDEVSAVMMEANLMPRSYTSYMYGAYESGKTYTPDQVTSVVFQTTEPTGYTDSWAVDDPDSPTGYPITSYIVPNGTISNGKTAYIQYIVCDASILIMDYPREFFSGYSNMTEIVGLDIVQHYGASDFYQMFNNCKSLTSIDLSNFYTGYADNMSMMFNGCSSLTSLDLTSFDTTNTVSMSAMFQGCSKLESIDLSTIRTDNANSLSNMFFNCYALKEIDVSNWNTSNVTSMQGMFSGCKALTSVDVSNFNTSKVTQMGSMFKNTGLTSLDLSNFDTISAMYMDEMFSSSTKLTNLNLSSFDTRWVQNMRGMFNDCSSLTSLEVSHFRTPYVRDMSYMFSGCSRLSELNVSNFDTSAVSNMSSMFNGCSGLSKLDVSNFDTSAVSNMSYMFNGCSGLLELDVSNFDTSNVTTMRRMFYSCSNLETIDVSSFETTNVTSMEGMFGLCRKVEQIDVSNFNTSKVTDMAIMFYWCHEVKELDISNFDTSKVTNMAAMFNRCRGLSELDVSNFDTSNVKCMAGMFNGCNNLIKLDLSNFDTRTLDGKTGTLSGKYGSEIDTICMFEDCTNLELLILGKNVDDMSSVATFSNTPKLTTIISLRRANSEDELMKISDDSCIAELETRKLYVADKNTELLYKQNDIYNAILDDSIQTIMTIKGANPTSIAVGSTYNESIDQGIDVFDLSEDEKLLYNELGFTTTTEGVSFNASTPGVKTVTYNLYYDGDLIDTQERIVNIVELPELMGRDGATNAYSDKPTVILGAYRAGKSTYTADLVARVIFSTTVPVGYIADGVWDVSYNEGDYAVVSYLVPSTTVTGLYDQYIVANGTIQAPEYSAGLFWSYTNMTEIVNLTQLDTSNVEIMNYMFARCESLLKLDLTHFNTSNATGMGSMFYCCYELTELKIPNFDTTNVTSMNTMFYNCKKLSSIDVSHFNTGNVLDMQSMFSGCKLITSLNVSNFDTSKVTNMNYMFMDCEKLATVDVGNFVTTSLTNMNYMFNNCKNITALDLSGFNTSQVTEMRYVFGGCAALTTLDVSSFNTTNVTIFRGMFSGCKKLTSLNLGSNFSTASAIDMGSMFWWCESLPKITLGNKFTSENATDMSYMFYNCSSLTSLNISMFDWSKAVTLNSMFAECTSLDEISFPQKTTTAAENTEAMFRNCSSLTILDARRVNVAGVKNMVLMFEGCSSLTTLNLIGFNTQAIDSSNSTFKWDDGTYCKGMDGLFNGCTNLETIILGVTFTRLDGKYMFDGCSSLRNIFAHREADVASGVMTGSTDNSLSSCASATLYVPNAVAEGFYEADSTYLSALTADRIEPMIDLIGDNPMKVTIGGTYTEPGAVVLGYDDADLSELESMGYSYAVTTPTISTSAEGTYEVTYTLSYAYSTNSHVTVATETRMVNVREMPVLMQGSYSKSYITGSNTRGGKTQYTADLLNKIIFADIKPENYEFFWDVSYNSGDWDIIAYIDGSTDRSGYYDLYIVADSKIKPKSCHSLFASYKNMTSIEGLEKLCTSDETTMLQMFDGCSSLVNLNLDSFDTSNVKDMSSMFRGCSSLTELNLSSFNTSKVTSMNAMFARCIALTNLQLSGFDTSNVKDMGTMFNRCESLSDLNVNGWNTGNVTSMNSMFLQCYSLVSLDLSSFNTNKVTSMYQMFALCSKLETLNINSFDTANVTSMGSMFMDCRKLTNLDLSNFNTIKTTNMSKMFYTCYALADINLSSFDTSNVTNMSYMFYICGVLELDVSSFDTSKVTNMSYMFGGCSKLTTLDLSTFNTSNVTNMSYMFNSCSKLTILNLSTFNTSKVTNMSYMFGSISSLEVLDLSNFDTTKVTSINNMFSSCRELTYIKLGASFDKINASNMFYNTPKLTHVISLRNPTSSGDIMEVSSDNYLGQLSTRVLYVPNTTIEGYYEENETYMSLLGSDRIQPIMSIQGSNPIVVEGGSIYGEEEDEGIRVLDWSEADATNYNNLGFTTTTSGLAVNTNTPAEKYVTYNLYYNGSLMDTQQRTVVIEGGNYLVGENYYQTLKEAIDAIPSTGTIYVMKDNVDDSEAIIPDTKNITLDLGTATITKTIKNDSKRGINNYGILTIKGQGAIYTKEASENNISSLIYNCGTLNVESGTLINKGSLGEIWITIHNFDNSITNISGGTVGATLAGTTNTSGWCRVIYLGGNNAEINITGGNIINDQDVGWLIEAYPENNDSENSVINISGGNFESAWGITLHTKDTDINMTGGNIVVDVTGIHVGDNDATSKILVRNASIETEIGCAINNKSTNNSVIIENSQILSNYNGVAIFSNSPNTTIGTNNDELIGAIPFIQGSTAIEAPNGFNFYDGILLGEVEAHTGAVIGKPDACEVSYGQLILEGTTYQMATLGTYLMKRDYTIDDNGEASATYVLGAKEAGYTQYTSDMIEEITFETVDSAISSYGLIPTWDVSEAQNGGIVAWIFDEDNNGLYELKIRSIGKIYLREDGLEMLFADYENCTYINGLENLVIPEVTTMYGTFLNDANLQEIDLTMVDTSEVTSFKSTFDGCESLSLLYFDNINTGSATNTKAMFRNCKVLSGLNVSAWRMTNVINMSSMFENCEWIMELDVSNWNTSAATNMSNMFKGCKGLNELDLRGWDVSKVLDVSGMFEGCELIQVLNLINFDLSSLSGAASKDNMFADCTRLEILAIKDSFNGLNGTDMFKNCTALQSIINVSPITNSSDAITLSTTTGLNDLTTPIFYVPNPETELLYEGITNYSSAFGTTRIKPILELAGDSRVYYPIGSEYYEEGYWVANKYISELDAFKIEGFDVTISGANKIDFTNMGIYYVDYTLTYEDPETGTESTFMKLTREVQVGAIEADMYISGKNEFDSTLSVVIDSTSIDEDAYTYQWYVNETPDTENGTPISGATTSSYTVPQGMVGKYIYVELIGRQEGFEDTKIYDITDDGMNLSGTVMKKSLIAPTIPNNLTYNGIEQTYNDSAFVEKYMTVSGNKATNAGTYTATFALKMKDDCEWNTHSTDDILIDWTISPKSIAVVWDETTDLVYNGSEQAPEVYGLTGVDGETAVLTSTTKINAGTYLFTATLTAIDGGNRRVENYTLINDSCTHEILKADPIFRVSPNSLNLTDGNSGYLNYETDVDSAITVTSANEDVAVGGEIDSTNRTIEIVSTGSGSTVISITLNETLNYNPATVTVTVGSIEANYTDGTNYYETLAIAFTKAESDSTITVLRDITESQVATLESGKTITLKLNNKNLTTNVNNFITLKGTLKIEEAGKISTNSTTNNLVYINSGSLTIGNGVVLEGYDTAVAIEAGSFVMNGGRLANKNASSATAVLVVGESATADIHAGTITAASMAGAILNEGTTTVAYTNNLVEIKNGMKYATVITNNGQFDINGASIEGQILNQAGNMTVKNSILEVESDGDSTAYEYAINMNAGNLTADNITMTGFRLLNLSGTSGVANLSNVTATTTDTAIVTTTGELNIDQESNIKSPVTTLEIAGNADIKNTTIETTSNVANDSAIYVKNTGIVTLEDVDLIADTSKAIKNEGELTLINETRATSKGVSTVLNDGTLTIENSTIENVKVDGGVTIDNNGTATLNTAIATSNGNVIDNSGIINMTNSQITSTSGLVMKTSGTANVYDGSVLKGATGIENTGTLTFGTADGNVKRDIITIDTPGRAINNENVFNWYDGQIKGNASIIYLGNEPVVEANVAIATETEGTIETRYVVKDVENPVIENLISETDWVKNSQTIQVVATDNVRIDGYAITETAEQPTVNSNIWTNGNTFSVTENKTYYIWVKDNAGNITGQQFISRWVCQDIWNTTGTTGSETRAVLQINGTLLFEVNDRAKGIDETATGRIKDYSASNAPWSNDARVKGIEVSQGITAIGNYGLSNARTATFVKIPESVTSIAESALYRTNNYSTLSVDAGNSKFIGEENAIYDKEKTIIYSYSPVNNSTVFVMPDTVKTVVTGLFYENTTSQEIYTSASITNVGADAFEFVTGDVYYYTSSYDMHTYAINNDTEANFIPIDNVAPVIESFVINDNDTAATITDVTLSIVATDDIKVDSIFASETYYTDADVKLLDASYWTTYSGTDYPFMLTSNQGTKYVYVWAKDTNGNISRVAEDYIYYGDVAFELYGQTDIVQYVDTTGRDYYKYLEDIQGGSTQIDKITIDVVGSVDHRNEGLYSLVYSVTIDGIVMQSKTRTVDVIANSWTGATGTTADGFEYIIHANGKYAKITRYNGSFGSTLTIPASVTHNGVACKVIDIGNNTVTNILGNTSNTTITKVVLPETIINISEHAFYGFAGLQNINIPSATMSISSNAFLNAGTTNGIAMVLPANFRELKANALYGARISSMDFGNTIRHIAENAFAKVTVPSGFIMELPASLEVIGTAAFESTRIYDIKIDENNKKYKLDSSDMALLTADGETLVIYPIASPFEEYVTDEGVKTIGIKAFKEADTLKVINLPSTLTTISASAFESATDVHTITNVKLVTTIGEYAFANTSLNEVELHRSLAAIEKGTFENTSIEFVRVPAGVTYIKEDAFKGISTLKSAVIESKPTMSSNAFGNCANLEFIMIGNQNGVATIADTTAIPQNTIVYVPSSMESLYEGDAVYMGYTNCADKIRPILKLVGEAEITWLVNVPYVEEGVELINEKFTVQGNSSKIDDLELVIEGTVDVTRSARTVINYIAKYKGTEVNRVIRTVDVEDYELPVINDVTTDSDWVAPKQTFVVDATDNIGVTHYIIVQETSVPSLDDSRWQTSNNLKVGTNGVWYIYVKDGAGNISDRKQVTASWVAAAKWDVSKKQDNTVHAIVSLDEKELIIKGTGETRDYSEKSTPWLADYADTITTITVQSGVTSIGNYLLGYLPNVTTINLSNTISKVVDGAFAYTNEFSIMNLNGNTNLSYSEGSLYNAARTELYVHTNQYTSDYVLPTTVTKICVAAFANSIYVSNFDLTNVVEIQSYAFNECLHMTNQYIPKTLVKIGKNVFAGARGPIYYYSSCNTMVNYVGTYGTESNFVEIDDIIPVINRFSINNNEAITNDSNVTLQIEATDNKAVSKIIIETTLSQNLTSADSRWTAFNGETELNYTLPNTNGIATVYAWVMDASGNISNVASDSIVLGENDFSLEYNDTIVQYVDKTPGGYYKFNEEVQGKYFVTTPGFTVEVNSNIDVTKVGEKQVVYKLSFNGTEAGEFYKIVDVIEDVWGTEVFVENGFSFVKHTSKNYAKIVKYTGSNTVTFPSTVTNGGVSYKVIEIESLDSNPVVSTSVTSVTLPNTIISIGKNAFVGCTSLKNIDFKENVMTIEENAFKNTGLTALDLKLNIREVKESAFENTNIATFNNSKLLKSVETKAFRNALNISELIIPNDIYNIDECAFGGSIIDKLSFAQEGVTGKYTIYENKYITENATNILLQYATGAADTEYIVTKNNISKIGAGAFMNAENIAKLVIKSTYSEMGEEAFRNTNLRVFEVPAEVKNIPAYAFSDSESLEVLVLSGATSIVGSAFEGNTALKAIGLLTSELCEIDDASKLNASSSIYVLNENKYKVSSYWSSVASKIFEIFRLNGDSYITTEAGFEYEELGVYAMDELFKASATYPEIDNLSIEVVGTVDTDKLGEQEITYRLKYKTSIKSEINRIVDVVDTIAPRIDNVNKIDEMQTAKERFTVIASDNHKIAGYAITQDPTEPLLDSTVWSDSNILHATVNGTWYVWVKDEAGNVSFEEVEATNICTERWDVGVVPNTVFAVITSDNCLLIEGVGAVKDFSSSTIPWMNYWDAIREIEITEGVTKLQTYTLSNMKNVTSISLPSTLESVATSTFAKTNNFTEIVFPNGTDTFIYENHNLYSADREILYVHSNIDTLTDYVIDENVKTIGEYAFANNSNIVTVTTTSNPTLLQGAFNNASTLESIIGNIGGSRIEAYTFENCTKLNSIGISEDVEYIGEYAFSNCNMLTNLELIMCTKLSKLEHHAFANLHNMKELKIYRSVTKIYSDAFGSRNVFENMGSNFAENAKVYYYEGCTAMEDYAKNYPDVYVDFILIDELGPRVEKLTVINQTSGMYAAGTVLEIVAEMTEEFVTYKGTIPSLSIAFGNGRAIALGEGVVDGKQLKYNYVITTDDLGELICASFTGELYDSLDNKTVFNSPETFDKEIIARTGVMLESDHEETKYFATLKDTADYITVGGRATMLLDESAEETAVFKANTLVSLDINGKKVTFNSKETNNLIINRGILNITDSGAGALAIVGNESGEVTAISNEGVLTVVNGIIRAQGSGDVTAYGVQNCEDAKITITGGSVEGINNTAMSYGIVNYGELRMEGGNIQSSTVEGKTYGLYNIGTANVINGQIAARISSGTKGETIAVYIENGTFVVGNGDATINPDNPIIYSTKDGLINNGGTLEFYDGFIEGQAYRSLSTDNVKVVPGFALIRKLIGDREKAMLDYDVVKPTIKLTNLTPDWTNESVIIEAHFIDEESGIQSAEHKGEKLELLNNKATVEVFENEVYTFKATDFAGNVTEESIEIKNIDRVAPTFENMSYVALANDHEVTFKVTIKDDAAGVYGYVLSKFDTEPTKWTKLDKILTESVVMTTITSNGKYYLYAIDDAGNISRYSSEINITNVDANAPKITSLKIEDEGKGFSNSSTVMIKVEAEDDTGVEDILLSNKLLTNNQVIDSEDWVPYTEDVIWNLPIGDGEKTVYVWVRDRVGRISRSATVTTKLLAQYIGNNGTNNTSYKFLIKDANYNFDKQLTNSDVSIKVKNDAGTTTYTGNPGVGVKISQAPIVYGPIQEGAIAMSGRYYFLETTNIEGNGTVYICFKNTVETDKAGNQILSNNLEMATDVTIELEAPVITVGSSQISVYDVDGHGMNVIRIDGKTIKLKNGVITKSELQSTYGMTITNGTVLEAFDKCGNVRRQVSQVSWGGSSTGTGEVFTFTYYNDTATETYIAEAGMTWGEWASSSYSQGSGVYVDASGIMRSAAGKLLTTEVAEISENDYLRATDVISKSMTALFAGVI